MRGPEDDAGFGGKVAMVSGGGAAGDGIGNGRAAAILLARAGAKVLVADRNLKLAERTVEMISAEGGTAAAHGGDVTSEGPIARHWSKRRSIAGAGSIFSTTMSASAAGAAWSTRRPSNIAASCRSMSRACSCSRSMRSPP
ncbi:NAD(P)-dependent dehydrogenase (short-subunit alcohol dehydrogenase family) [Bradyrhizobium sp. LM6.11]